LFGGREGEGGKHEDKGWKVRMTNVPNTRQLTKKQTALVDTIVARGCTIAKAAEAAGYSAGESGRVTATKTMKLPHV